MSDLVAAALATVQGALGAAAFAAGQRMTLDGAFATFTTEFGVTP